MAIVSSEYEVGVPQADGRTYVVELHTDDLGNVYRYEYGPVGVVDYEAIMTERASQLEALLSELVVSPFIEA